MANKYVRNMTSESARYVASLSPIAQTITMLESLQFVTRKSKQPLEYKLNSDGSKKVEEVLKKTKLNPTYEGIAEFVFYKCKYPAMRKDEFVAALRQEFAFLFYSKKSELESIEGIVAPSRNSATDNIDAISTLTALKTFQEEETKGKLFKSGYNPKTGKVIVDAKLVEYWKQ